jgi:PP-loop superfamily ATP-utilizing enzyme
LGLKKSEKTQKKFWQNKKSCYLCRPENRETVPARAERIVGGAREGAGHIDEKREESALIF